MESPKWTGKRWISTLLALSSMIHLNDSLVKYRAKQNRMKIRAALTQLLAQQKGRATHTHIKPNHTQRPNTSASLTSVSLYHKLHETHLQPLRLSTTRGNWTNNKHVTFYAIILQKSTVTTRYSINIFHYISFNTISTVPAMKFFILCI